MRFELTFFSQSLIEKQAVNEILKCNELTEKYGLLLTEAQALELVETRTSALNANGRIEFGGGIIDKIIYDFCDSPYISKYNYEETLHRLIEMFYYYKNEVMDLISDDDLIEYMKKSFDGVCQGSLEALEGRELYKLAQNIRYGYEWDYSEDDELDDEEDEYNEYDEYEY